MIIIVPAMSLYFAQSLIRNDKESIKEIPQIKDSRDKNKSQRIRILV